MESVDSKKLYKLVGENIRRARIEVDLTQAEFADRLGLQRTSITNIEKGNQKPSLDLLYQICTLWERIELKDLLPEPGGVKLVEEVSVGEKTKEVPPKTAIVIRKFEKFAAG